MGRRGGSTKASLDGVVVLDKPAGITSHDAVYRARKILSERRIGHGGTLDPDATGVLVLGVGRVTRLLRFVLDLKKSYVGEMVLGSSTTTLDASGEVTATFVMDDIGLDEVREAARQFCGEIDQVPPMVSAVKVEGRRLYELARQGLDIERVARRVTVFSLQASATEEPNVFRLDLDCSSGTFVRSIAADLGAALGGGAHLRALRRVRVGPFGLESAVPLEELSRADLLPPSAIVSHLPPLVVDDQQKSALSHGAFFERADLDATGDGPWAVFDRDNELLAVYETRGASLLKPSIVLGAPLEAAPDS